MAPIADRPQLELELRAAAASEKLKSSNSTAFLLLCFVSLLPAAAGSFLFEVSYKRVDTEIAEP